MLRQTMLWSVTHKMATMAKEVLIIMYLNTMIIICPFTGQVFVYNRASGTYSVGARLSASDGTNGNKFGATVHGNEDGSGVSVTFVVGAPGTDSNRGFHAEAIHACQCHNFMSLIGAAYFFKGDFTPTGIAIANDRSPNNFFGCSATRCFHWVVWCRLQP
jgi:hypothetical protein